MITIDRRWQDINSQQHPHAYILRCKSCGSGNVGKLRGEVAMRFPGLKNIDEPVVRVFPNFVVCLDCGIAQFAVPETELRVLTKRDAVPG